MLVVNLNYEITNGIAIPHLMYSNYDQMDVFFYKSDAVF